MDLVVASGMMLPSALFLAAAVALDLVFGDPNYSAHPVRLIGWTLTRSENALRRFGFNGYGGGILLFLLLAVVWVNGSIVLFLRLNEWVSVWLLAILHTFIVYSMIALGDLLHHGRAVANAPDLASARIAIAKLVGRDTSMMDEAACRRAAIESLSENLTDGFISPVFWYLLGGIPGIILFKVVSTMDSMVGYKTPRYLQFGWCGARLDDVMNFVPARTTWLLMGTIAGVVPQCSAKKAWTIGAQQHALVPGPNSGWSEAAMAGAIQRRLVGPIYANGALVTEVWLGDANDPPAATREDYRRAAIVTAATGLTAVTLAIAVILAIAILVVR